MTEDFDEKLKKQKANRGRRIADVTKKSYIANTIKDCLLIFGREFLRHYFSKYFFEFAEKSILKIIVFFSGYAVLDIKCQHL